MKGKHLAIGVAILAILTFGVLIAQGEDLPTTEQVIEAYKAGNTALLKQYYRAYGGDGEWGSYAEFEARVIVVIKHRAKAAAREAARASFDSVG